MNDERYEIVLRKIENGWYAGSDRTDFPGGNRIEVAGWPTAEIAVTKLVQSLMEDDSYPRTEPNS